MLTGNKFKKVSQCCGTFFMYYWHEIVFTINVI